MGTRTRLDAVALREPLLDRRWERSNLCRPALRVVLLEAVEKLLKHVVQLRRRVVPAHDSVAEPEQALRYGEPSSGDY